MSSMASILIDTQILVWLINSDVNLGKRALTVLRDSKNRVLLSYFSLFEITIKASIGKLTYQDSLLEDLPKMNIEILMPELENLHQYTIFNPDNKDPFDNILIATALTEKAKFMTSDRKILASKIPSLRLVNALL